MVKAPIGSKFTALLFAFEFKNVILELESITGLVLAFKATDVKPERKQRF